MWHWITVLPRQLRLQARDGDTLLSVLRNAGLVMILFAG